MTMKSSPNIIATIRDNIRYVKKLVSEALNAIRRYDIDTAQNYVNEAVRYLDIVSRMIEELEVYAYSRSVSGYGRK